MQPSNEIPLTFSQNVRLLLGCLPVVFFTLALIFVLTWYRDLTDSRPSLFLILFLSALVFFMGWIAINRLQDVFSGVALIQEDVLERAWRSGRSSRSRPFNGQFTHLGKMQLTSKAWGQSQNGARYRIYYSPVSKIVWSLKKLE